MIYNVPLDSFICKGRFEDTFDEATFEHRSNPNAGRMFVCGHISVNGWLRLVSECMAVDYIHGPGDEMRTLVASILLGFNHVVIRYDDKLGVIHDLELDKFIQYSCNYVAAVRAAYGNVEIIGSVSENTMLINTREVV